MFDGPRNWEVLFRLARSLSKSSKPEVIRAQLLKFSWHGIKAHGPEFSENKLYGLIAAASSMIQKEKDSTWSKWYISSGPIYGFSDYNKKESLTG